MEFRRSSIKGRSNASSMFYGEFPVPSVATGAVIGKKGIIINGFQNSPGISSVKLSSRRVQVVGESEEAVHGVVLAIERIVCLVLSRAKPDFIVTCFCKSLAEPSLAVKRICFEMFAGEISTGHREADGSYFCFKTGDICENVAGEGSGSGSGSPVDKLCHDMDNLSAPFSGKMGIEFVNCSQWDFSAYKSTLLSCLHSLPLKSDADQYETVRLVIRFGKLLFHIGPTLSKSVEKGDFVSVSCLQDFYTRRELKSFFSTACSDRAVRDVRLHLDRLQYVKASSGKKIIIHVADLIQGPEQSTQRYNLSLRCEEGGAAVVTKVRRFPTRHGFVTFCREGQTTSDFRLGISTHQMDPLNNNETPPGMLEWVEQAWKDRTTDQLLVFPPPGRFLAFNIRYKETETYFVENWKLGISNVTGGERIKMEENKVWECKLSSRWFKGNYGTTGTGAGNSRQEDVDFAVESDVVALVKEAVKFSEVVCPCT